jgi:hypothetical protein
VVVLPENPDTVKRDRTMEVMLERCGSLSGRVLDDDGAPMTYAVVRLYADIEYPASASSGLPISVEVQGDGTFCFDRLIAGVGYHLNILGDGHAVQHHLSVRARPGESQSLPEIRLPWADQFVSGIVIDARGHGISGATVGYERERRRDDISPPSGCHWFQQTDAYGRFRLSGLPRGTIKLLAHRPTEGRSVRQMIRVQARAGAMDVRIVVPDVDERLRGIE